MTEATLTEAQQQAVDDFSKFPAWQDARMLPIDSLEFTDWNVNEMSDAEFSELVAEVEEGGFDEPLGVIPIPGEAAKYLVPSGEHRARAAIALEMEQVPAVLKVHLTEKEKHEVQLWSVKRNHIRGRVNEQKWRKLEKSISDKTQTRAEIVRQRALLREETLQQLGKGREERDARRRAAADKKRVGADPTPAADDPTPAADESGAPPAGPKPGSDQDARDGEKARESLGWAFKAAWEEALMHGADTVENGYLVFADGKDEKCHVIVDTGKYLAPLVKRMVAACRGSSAHIDEFLVTAITKELKEWEDK